jgi:hypothetical protein
MGSVAESWRDYRGAGSPTDFGGVGLPDLPELNDLLRGKANAAGTAWERPPLGLRLYLDGSLVRFVFSNSDFKLCLWGSVKSLKDGLAAIEEALCRGHCDWRENKRHDNGWTKHNK